MRKELENVQRKMTFLEEDCQKKTHEIQLAVDQQMRCEQQTAEQRRRLESALESAGVQVSDARVELEGTLGRVQALEAQLSRSEERGRDLEVKLGSVVSTLRRSVIGILPGEASGVLQKTRSRSSSPRRGETFPLRFTRT